VTDEKVLLMPTIESRCAGRFAHLPPGAEVSEDRRFAVLHAPGLPRSEWVDLVYEVGSDECPDGALAVMPPFLVEVDPEDLEAYADLLAEASADVLPVPEDEIEEDWP
jgi:hypothetical protein